MLEMKNLVMENKIVIDRLISRLKKGKRRISKLENIQNKRQREKKSEKRNCRTTSNDLTDAQLGFQKEKKDIEWGIINI